MIENLIHFHLIFSRFSNNNKVTVVGIGNVGMACILSILAERISNDIAIVDINEKKLAAEMMDLQHASIYLNNPKIQASSGKL